MQDTRNIEGRIWDENTMYLGRIRMHLVGCGIVLKLLAGCEI